MQTTNLIVNLEDEPQLWLPDEATLVSLGLGQYPVRRPVAHAEIILVENEAEISFFNKVDYDEYVLNPETKW